VQAVRARPDGRGLRVAAVAGVVLLLLGFGAVTWSLTRSGARGSAGTTATRTAAPAAGGSVFALDSVPSGALVFVDEERAGTTPFKRRVEPGVYVVEARKAGFKPWRKRISVGLEGWTGVAELTPEAPPISPAAGPTERPPSRVPGTLTPSPVRPSLQKPTLAPKGTQAPTPQPRQTVTPAPTPTPTPKPTPAPTEEPFVPPPPG